MFNKKKYALVLGGGGAKGAYEIGAWKALKELGIKFNAIIGNSVGSLNGALIAQGNYKTAEKLWETTTIEKIINIPKELVKDGKFYIDSKNFNILKNFQQLIFQDMGLDTNPLKNLIKKAVNEKIVRKKKIDFGLLTFKINDFKPLEIFIDDIPQGLLCDYLLASASLPGFKSTEIQGKKYIDGGVYDNVPFGMAKNRGYKNIIVIDISGLGLNRTDDITGTNTIYIKNSINIGNILDFNPKTAKDLMKLGYLDVMKVFGKNIGVKYFYNFDKKLIQKLENLLFAKDTIKDYFKYLNEKKVSNERFYVKNYINDILPNEYKNYKYLSLALAECAALSLNIERNNLYNFEDLINLIGKKYGELEAEIAKQSVKNKSFFEMLTGKLLNNNLTKNFMQFINKTLHEYENALEIIFGKNDLHIKALNNFFPHLLGSKIFIVLLKKYLKKE